MKINANELYKCLKVEVIHEISMCNNYTTLFRNECASIDMIHLYLKSTKASDFIRDHILVPLDRRMKKDADYTTNLMMSVTFVLNTFFLKRKQIPKSLRIVCQLLFNKIKNIYNKKTLILFGGFFFLRWLCPELYTFESENHEVFKDIASYLVHINSFMENSSMRVSSHHKFEQYNYNLITIVFQIRDIIDILLSGGQLVDHSTIEISEEFLEKIQTRKDALYSLSKRIRTKKMAVGKQVLNQLLRK